jgi:UDP-glucuronate 4-epimerase
MHSDRGTTLVTGAAGFIGSHVVESLLTRGDRVVGIDNLDPYYAPRLKRANLRECSHQSRNADSGAFEFIEADFCDHGAMLALFAKMRPSGVIHLGAKAGVRPSIEDPVGYARVNVMGTSVLLDAAAKHGCERFVMASSSSVYGNNPVVPFSEDHDVSRPISPYAATKRACELIAHTHWHLTRMPTACLRFFTVFGPRQRPDLAISTFLKLVSRGETVPMFGDGSSSRDYTFIDDIVTGVLSAHDRIPGLGYRIWNLGGNEPVSLREMISVIGSVVGKEPQVRQLPERAGDVERTYADLSRSAAELGYHPRTGFADGVARQWQWFQATDSA